MIYVLDTSIISYMLDDNDKINDQIDNMSEGGSCNVRNGLPCQALHAR